MKQEPIIIQLSEHRCAKIYSEVHGDDEIVHIDIEKDEANHEPSDWWVFRSMCFKAENAVKIAQAILKIAE